MTQGETQILEALKLIFEKYGQDLIQDSVRMNALLMDLAPSNNKERKLVCSVLREGVGHDLLKVIDGSENEQRQCMRRCIHQIKSDTWIAEEAAEFAIQILASAVGISCEISNPNRPKREKEEPQTDPVRHVLVKGEHHSGVERVGMELSSYQEIGYKAFAADMALKDAEIPESVKIIRSRAFQNCIHLESVQLPSGLEHLGACVFRGCGSLKNIGISQGKKYTVVNGMLINKERKTLIRAQNEPTRSELQIPGEIAEVESFAFDSSPVKMIRIPKSTRVLAQNSFQGCVNLERFAVDPQNSEFASAEGALYTRNRKRLLRYPIGCQSNHYYLEDEAEEISERAFSGALHLQSITFSNRLQRIGTRAFEECGKLETMMLPASVQVIGERAFQLCSSLTSLMLPRSIEEIGDFAFYGCKSIQTLSVPQNVQRIGHAAFQGCEDLKKIVLQSNVSFIGDGAFEGCSPGLTVFVRNNSYVETYCRVRGIRTEKL